MKRKSRLYLSIFLICSFAFQIVGPLIRGINVNNDKSVTLQNSLDSVQNEEIRPSDTIITKNWEAEETLSSWWNASWLYRRKITITEPGLMDRDREPVDIYVEFTGDRARVNSIRLTYFGNDSNWYEVESQVWNTTMHINGTGAQFYDSCTIMFFLNITKNDVDVYYIYYDPYINTPPSYPDRISVQARNRPDINDDTRVMPSVTHVNGTTWNNVDSFEIIYDNNTATPQSTVCVVDTERGASDWGGASCSIVSALYGGTDTLNLNSQVWMSIGEMALDAIGYDSENQVSGGFSGNYRVNVGPDNPAEAWDGNGRIEVVEDGPLFTKIEIQTTDGAFADIIAGTWYRSGIYGINTDDNYIRANGGLGYVKYNITYTFYYYEPATFVKIDFSFGAFPQRGVAAPYPLTGYPDDTDVYFKNYGDWPHLMQIVDSTDGPVYQENKSWYGSKYGLYTDDINARRRDYPLEPWTAWFDRTPTGGTYPAIGMMAETDGIGWEVLSLAVNGIGPNSLLQQILPEGHQGDQYLLTNGTVLNYTYYMLTSAYGQNYTQIRDIARRVNKKVIIEVSGPEFFGHNGLFIHVNDIDGNTAFNTTVNLYYASNDSLIYSEPVDDNGNVTFLLLPDDTYKLNVTFRTLNTLTEYEIKQDSFSLDHNVNRSTFLVYNCNLANLTFNVTNWARPSETITGAQVRILNATDNNTIEQNITWDGFVKFRLFTDGNTQYNIQIWHGGIQRKSSIDASLPYTLTGNDNLNVGIQIDPTAITIISQ
ncbi:MAG: hypothetical protein ACTSWN_04915, partial [Promethearchaeota archaeon]